MTVALVDGTIRLTGDCTVEEAETLSGLLAAHPGAEVDVSACASLHAAVLQALMSFAPRLHGTFADRFLNLWIRPALAAAAEP